MRSSAAARTRWGFAELEQLRTEAGLTVSRFCQIVGLARRTYYDRRAAHARGRARGPWPTLARDGIRASVIETALAYPMWGHRRIAWLCRRQHDTGEITLVVSDNGPCFKGATFARFIASRPELTHVRTRRKSPQTNGVIERTTARSRSKRSGATSPPTASR